MATLTALYKELASKLDTDIAEVKWVDLWHNQINFLEDEYPFPAPAVFLAFRSDKADDAGDKVQTVDLQVDVYLYYETYADTYNGGINQDEALSFMDIMDNIFKTLHGSSGMNYSNMARTAFGNVDTGGAGNLYRNIYTCSVTDYGVDAQNTDTTDLTPNGADIDPGQAPPNTDPPLFNPLDE